MMVTKGQSSPREPHDVGSRINRIVNWLAQVTQAGNHKRTQETFRRHERLRRRRDFERLRAGRMIRGTILTIRFLPSPTNVSRLGVQVGKRVGSAVVRNKVKRRLREQFRRIKHRIKEPTDLVLWACPKSATASSAMIRQDLERLLAQARLLQPVADLRDRPIL
ncbi:MAG: ribonuclease P protein component [bacterium]